MEINALTMRPLDLHYNKYSMYVLWDILLSSITEYFYEPVGGVKIQTKS